MSKILAIGDIHGRDVWKDIVKKETFDVCVFVGDYFDSFHIDADTQIKNFKEIVAFRKKSKSPVILLMGNHDLHYLVPNERYSGYNKLKAPDIHEALKKTKDILKAYQVDNFLFTHAGVTKTWLRNWGLSDSKHLAEDINKLPLTAFTFDTIGATSSYGDDPQQSCQWVRPASLKEDGIKDFVQVVGHTDIGGVVQFSKEILLIDALEYGEYAVIINGEVQAKKI